MTREQLTDIRERCENATSGEWVTPPSFRGICSQSGDICVMIGRRVDDAIFIAHAREDVPALLDALTDAEADRDRWKERAEALERALEMQTEGLCEYCTGYGRECPECSYSEREGWNFCFDEARFKECETCQDP